MAKERYFFNFPKITYSNTKIVDITKRVSILESVSKNPYIFYPYEITQEERPDQLSFRYYDDPYKSWLIYLTNKIIDPYYEWYLQPREFEEFLTKKYGSIQKSFEKIYFYRNDWIDDEKITVGRYDSLPARLKIYWQPLYTATGEIYSYERKQKNWIVNTNKIFKYDVSNSSFLNNEVCNIHFDNTYTGKGQIVKTTNTSIYVQHTSGVTLANGVVLISNSSYIYGNESNVNTSFSTSTLFIETLVDEEEIYWKPITYYDYENEKNEFNKTLRLIDNRFSDSIVKEFKQLMSD